MCNCDCSENAYGISLTVLVTTYMDFGVVSKALIVSYMFHTFFVHCPYMFRTFFVHQSIAFEANKYSKKVN